MALNPNFMGPTAYQALPNPAFLNMKADDAAFARRMLEKAVERRAEFLAQVAAAIHGMTVQGVRANRTGNKVDVKVAIGKRRQVLHLCTVESKDRPRTPASVAEEAMRQIVEVLEDPFPAQDSKWKRTVVDRVGADAQEAASNAGKGFVHVYSSDVMYMLLQRLRALIPQGGGLTEVWKAFHGYMATGDVHRNRNSHQIKRAMDGVRNAALHAFKHGAEIEDVVTAVRESLVQGVLES